VHKAYLYLTSINVLFLWNNISSLTVNYYHVFEKYLAMTTYFDKMNMFVVNVLHGAIKKSLF